MSRRCGVRYYYMWGVRCVFYIKPCNFWYLISDLTRPLMPYMYIKQDTALVWIQWTLTNNNHLYYKFQKCVCLDNNQFYAVYVHVYHFPNLVELPMATYRWERGDGEGGGKIDFKLYHSQGRHTVHVTVATAWNTKQLKLSYRKRGKQFACLTFNCCFKDICLKWKMPKIAKCVMQCFYTRTRLKQNGLVTELYSSNSAFVYMTAGLVGKYCKLKFFCCLHSKK